jgi:dolichol-phosphate mannosyltransferase
VKVDRGGDALAPRAIAVVVPTYNERANIRHVVESVRGALDGEAWELVFVDDDSPDGTWEEIQRWAVQDARVRRLRRVGRRGLASACIEGAMASAAPYVAVMDADGQHDPAQLRAMLARARESGCDVVVAAREQHAGRESFRRPLRRWLTRAGNAIGRVLAQGVTSDPLSGYFLARREVFEQRVGDLYGHGFKILLDLLSASRAPLRVENIAISLKPRREGESKLGFGVALDYALLVAYRLTGHLVSPRFVLYCAVGAVGVGVHLATLQAVFSLTDGHFLPAQATATFVAMTGNYFLNNLLTFRDRMLRGAALWAGLVHFYFACSLGAVVGIAVGELLYGWSLPVWVAGGGGALASAVWNFTLNNAFTWRQR